MACLGIIITLQPLSAPALARYFPDKLNAKLVMANPCAFSTFNNGLFVNLIYVYHFFCINNGVLIRIVLLSIFGHQQVQCSNQLMHRRVYHLWSYYFM